MPRIFQVNELAMRKRLLVAESELYRETLKLDIQTVRLYGFGVRQKLNAFRTSNPWVTLASVAAGLLGTPLGGMLVKKRQRTWLRLALTAVMGWRLYRKLAPLAQWLFPRQSTPGPAEAAPETDKTPASE